ncbi:MAG: hypothetical protein F4120_09455 [Rhodothermaceae bacterium]|nr:hypothetical protein [Rhodothermaceae bacterium]MYC03582.1 hypothetical protein [Rhodothermaceae bacterium]MYI17831.1 hypothetical protein [Rhodothermaceae bacterium]
MSSFPPAIDLRPDHWQIVQQILQRQLPDRHVYAFGSRATWTAKDYSDLDLAIMGEQPLPPAVLSALNEEFIESDLPFRVDIVDFASVDDSFRAIIQHHGVSVQSPLDVISSTTHISKEELRTIRRLVEKHLPNTDAWVYGDRLKEEPNRRSDLNIVVFSTPEQQQRVSDLREAFGESDLSFRVNLLVSEEGAEGIHKEIKKGFFVIVTREQKRNSTNWREVSIGEIADIIGGGTPSTKDPENFNGSVPWLTPKDLSGTHERYIRRGERNLSQKGLESSSAKLLPENSVLLSTRAPIGYVALAKNPIATNQGFRNLIARDDVVPEFLYYWLKSNTQELERHSSGSVFQELSGSALRDISIKLAPLSEQRSIIHVLGSLDDKIELNGRMNTTLEAMARALFKSWFVDFDPVRAKMGGRDTGLPKHIADLFPGQLVKSEIGEIPKGWDVTTLGKISLKPQYGFTASAKLDQIGPKFLRITDINKSSWINWSQVPYCKVSDDEFSKYHLRIGDVLIARMADPGHGVLVEEEMDAVFASDLIRFQPLKSLHRHFLQYWIRSEPYWQLVRSRAAGTTRKSLNARVLSSFMLTMPMDPVAQAFEQIISSYRSLVLKNAREILLLSHLRDALLPKLISGEFCLSEAGTVMETRA